jgi:hypothetical protein
MLRAVVGLRTNTAVFLLLLLGPALLLAWLGFAAAEWAGYDEAGKLAAVVVLHGFALPSAHGALVEFLRQQEPGASAELKAALTYAISNLTR